MCLLYTLSCAHLSLADAAHLLWQTMHISFHRGATSNFSVFTPWYFHSAHYYVSHLPCVAPSARLPTSQFPLGMQLHCPGMHTQRPSNTPTYPHAGEHLHRPLPAHPPCTPTRPRLGLGAQEHALARQFALTGCQHTGRGSLAAPDECASAHHQRPCRCVS